jgi:hypothetical protein
MSNENRALREDVLFNNRLSFEPLPVCVCVERQEKRCILLFFFFSFLIIYLSSKPFHSCRAFVIRILLRMRARLDKKQLRGVSEEDN